MSGPYSSDGIPITSGQRFSARIVQNSGSPQTFPRIRFGVAQLEPQGRAMVDLPDFTPLPVQPIDWNAVSVENGAGTASQPHTINGAPWMIGRDEAHVWDGTGWVREAFNVTNINADAGVGWDGGSWAFNSNVRLASGNRYLQRWDVDTFNVDTVRANLPIPTVRYAFLAGFHYFFMEDGEVRRKDGNAWVDNDGDSFDPGTFKANTIGSVQSGVSRAHSYDLTDPDAGFYIQGVNGGFANLAWWDNQEERLDLLAVFPWMEPTTATSLVRMMVYDKIVYLGNVAPDGSFSSGELWWWSLHDGTYGQIVSVPARISALQMVDGTMYALAGSTMYEGVLES